MRVIAGKAKGTRLGSVPGSGTRPTLDRVKEALFNILQTRISGADFLDLFAGNGGIGIEALSRGARQAVLVDCSPACIRMIRQNLSAAKLDGAQVLAMPVHRAVEKLSRAGIQFDIIFLDPPYGQGLVEKTLIQLSRTALLRQGGVVVAEHGVKEEINLSTSKFERNRQEKYGDTVLGFFTLREDEHDCE